MTSLPILFLKNIKNTKGKIGAWLDNGEGFNLCEIILTFLAENFAMHNTTSYHPPFTITPRIEKEAAKLPNKATVGEIDG